MRRYFCSAFLLIIACASLLTDSEDPLAVRDASIRVLNTKASGPGSFEEAITKANALGSGSSIEFQVPESDPGIDPTSGICTIRLKRPLPPLTAGGVTIDGLNGTDSPRINLVPAAAGIDHALCLASPSNRVKGLSIGGFKYGMVLIGPLANQNTVTRCFLGVLPDGESPSANETGIIFVQGASKNTLDRCVVSGNSTIGVYLGDQGTSRNVVTGCRIGTDVTGAKRVPNRTGVMIARSSENVIGPDTVVSGNDDIGILMVGKWTERNIVRGCLIGVDAGGARPVHNNIGIVIKSLANGNAIGGVEAGAGNVISGNVQIGVYIEAAHRNTLEGNLLGTDATGMRAVEEAGIVQGNGVEFNTVAQGNVLGGTSPGARNVISGHKVYGVVYYGHCERNTTQGNYIGTDRTGTRALPNATGICVDCASHHNDILDNVISGNMSYGLFFVTRGTEHNVLRGNLVGTAANGATALPNDMGMVVSTGACRNVIGGPEAEHGNVFSGNSQAGMMITNRYTEENLVENNIFGLNAEGKAPVPNRHGVILSTYPTANTLRRNRISGNTEAGIVITEYAVGNRLIDNTVEKNGVVDILDLIPEGTPAPGHLRATAKPRPATSAEPTPVLSPLPVDGRKVFTVTNTRNDGRGSLRQAVESCAAGGPCSILFDIPREDNGFDASSGTWRITLREALPPVTVSDVVLDGASQTTARGDTNPAGPEIILDGSGHTVESAFLLLNATRVTIRGFAIGGFVYGIQVFGPGSRQNRIVGCHVGIDAAGSELFGNYNGIELISGANGNVIGGTLPAERNVISGNLHIGLRLSDASRNVVLGNYVGLDRTGSFAVPNYDGICIEGQAAENVIGGIQAAARNVFSGNMAYGVDLFGWGVTRNRVIGNFIGTDASGAYAVSNTYGVLFDDRSHHNTVGGKEPGEWNLISGNTAFGAYFYNNGTHSNKVIGNRIGTDSSGTVAIPNETGVHIDGGTFDNTVDGNLISGNLIAGITLFSIKTDRNVITRNRIGTAIDGAQPLGNGTDGIRIVFGASFNRIGGTPAEGNVIAHNGRTGVMLESKSQRNRISGNRIYANAAKGIDIASGTLNRNVRSPVITSANLSDGVCVVSGTVSLPRPDSTVVEVFLSDTLPGLPAQGCEPLGSATPDADGLWVLNVTKLRAGTRVTATVTSSDGATSEFSKAHTVVAK